MNSLLIAGLGIGAFTGVGLSILVEYFLKNQKIKRAKLTALDIVQQAKDSQESQETRNIAIEEKYKTHNSRQRYQDQELFFRTRRKLQKEIDQYLHKQKLHCHMLESGKNKKTYELQSLSSSIKDQTQKLIRVKTFIKEKKQDFIKHLQQKFSIDQAQIKAAYKEEQINKIKTQTINWITKNEENFKQNLNTYTHAILDRVLSRFLQAYCPERGIKNILFSNKKSFNNLLDKDQAIIKQIEKECGVDIKVSDKEPSMTVFGIDPVRKELGRSVLQAIANKRYFKESDIKRLVQEAKRQLFQQIHHDGERIVQALALRDIHSEVKNLMGALRYRYSFAQNQYFHCLEVGWLCGMLYAEMAEDVMTARRAGMLHDIGKAIDYSKEGGHAVIGADFIQKWKEPEHIVHAVRAHHYDVSPENPLDFLVIAADALSGARPGARRSTVDSYNQKVLTLEKIGRSFKGVKDTYIMSAGREIRVIVDSKQIDDRAALDLSKKIAQKIEEECSYPGLIKVTVMRTVTSRVDTSNL